MRSVHSELAKAEPSAVPAELLTKQQELEHEAARVWAKAEQFASGSAVMLAEEAARLRERLVELTRQSREVGSLLAKLRCRPRKARDF